MTTSYHDQMVRLATAFYENHQLVPHPGEDPDPNPDALRQPPWMLESQGTWRERVSIQPLAFGRLIVHGSCDPVVFGGYKHHPEPAKYHDIVDLIGSREARYLDYVAGKVVSSMEPYYDETKAEQDLDALFADSDEVDDDGNSIYDDIELEDRALIRAGAIDRINAGDWHGLHTYLYEEMDIEAEYISDLGRVLAPPRFYYAVFAVKRLWELLEEAE